MVLLGKHRPNESVTTGASLGRVASTLVRLSASLATLSSGLFGRGSAAGVPRERRVGQHVLRRLVCQLGDPLILSSSPIASPSRLAGSADSNEVHPTAVCSEVEPQIVGMLALARRGLHRREACTDGRGGSITVQPAVDLLFFHRMQSWPHECIRGARGFTNIVEGSHYREWKRGLCRVESNLPVKLRSAEDGP